MKQIITLAIALILIIGCSSQTSKASHDKKGTCVYYTKYCQVHILKVKGHEYLVSYTSSTYGGTCIIHAAHCSCQKQTK